MATLEDELIEGLGLANPYLLAIGHNITVQTLRFSQTDSRAWYETLSLTEGLGFANVTPAYTYTTPKTISDGLSASIAVAQKMTYKPVRTEDLGVVDPISAGWPKSLTAGLGLARSVTIAHAKTVAQTLGLTRVLTPVTKYKPTLTDGLGLSDTLARFLGGDIIEGLAYSPAVSRVTNYVPTIEESLIATDFISRRFLLRLTATEGLGLEDVDAPGMAFNPTLTEGIELSAAYIAPDGSVTTWAINTRTGAVTEYTNYDFNSFAKMGNKYLAASSDGLYELLGDDDDGTDIISKMKTGFAQFAGSHLCHFKAIYLGVRNGGSYYLRIETAEGTNTTYELVAEDMKTTRVQVGKGLRARYFSFELENVDGQDFDLESIEFVPMVVQRRR
jgi:hypothetical protein